MTRNRNKAEYATTARTTIRQAFDNLPIFRRSAAHAVYNYVAAAEVDAPQSASGYPPTGLAESHRRLVESSAIAIPAMYERCPNISTDKPEILNPVFHEARELYDFSHDQSQVDYSFELADRGKFDFVVAKKDPRITFIYASPEAD